MKVGDLVQHWLTEQIGIVLRIGSSQSSPTVQVIWTTQGLSLFDAGGTEWVTEAAVEVLA